MDAGNAPRAGPDSPTRSRPRPVEYAIVSPILIGRDAQLAALGDLCRDAAGGQGRTVLLSGEAGIGKSRLVREVQARFRDTAADALCIQGQCFEPDHALPYAPLLDLLRALPSTGSPAALAGFEGADAPVLATLLPELAGRMPDLPAPGPLDPAQEKRRLFAALLRAVLALAEPAPALIVVEDLHWCDDTSLEWLLHLARRLTGVPLLLVLTYRSDEVGPELRHFLAELDRTRLAVELSLPPLDRAEMDELIRAIFHQPQAVRAEFLDVVYALTEGNPFFIEEILKALLVEGDIFYSFGAWTRKSMTELHIPRTVQDAVERRARQLSPPARDLLTLAAVVGRRADFGLLLALTGAAEADLLGMVKELIAAQLLVEESADRVAFRHALTRQAVYATLLGRERAALHQRIAAVLARLDAGAPDIHAADLAYHYYAAGAWEDALRTAQRAGDQARRLYAARAAHEQYSHALDATAHLGRVPAAALLRARGQTAEWLGDFDGARTDYLRALDVARQGGDARAEWQSLLDLGFLWTGHDYGRAGDYLEAALAVARHLDDPATLAQTLNRVGNWRANADQPLEGRRHHEEALAIFAALGDRAGEAATLDLLGVGSLIGGDLLASADYYARAVPLFRALGDRPGLASCLAPFAVRGASYMTTTLVCPPVSVPGCLAEGEEAVAITRDIGWRSGESFSLMYLALILGAVGAYARAFAVVQDCIHVAVEIEHQVSLAGGYWTLGALHLDLLAPETAQPHTARALDLARQVGSAFLIGAASAFHAQACIALGDFAGATAVLDSAAGPDTPMQTLTQRLIWAARADLALAHGDFAAALVLVERLIASAAGLAPGGVIPRLWYLRGRALAGLGRPGEADVVLQAAATAPATQMVPPLRWRILARLAQLYQAGGRREEAAVAAADARAIVEALAADVSDAGLRERFLQRAAAQWPVPAPPTPLQAAKRAFGGLTAREREVAALIAQGQTNREIAAALFLSPRTVQVHITNLMAKLDLTSRTQVAVWAVEKGLAARAPSLHSALRPDSEN